MKSRIISAVIMLIITVPIIIFGEEIYMLGISLVSILAYKEIMNLKRFDGKIPVLVKIVGMLSLLCIIAISYLSGSYQNIIITSIVLPVVLLLMPALVTKENKYDTTDALYLLGLIILLGLGFIGLLYARENIYIFIYLISIAIFSDIFAYITGMLIGKHKLCPEISPKKTIEGSVGGFVVGVTVPLILYANLIGNIDLMVVVSTVILAIFAQLGDLIFSKIKRDNHTKDFSNLIPGHGGVLDRIDSILIMSIIFLMFGTFL